MPVLVPQVHALTGGTKRTRALYHKGVDAALKALNSPDFKNAVHEYSWVDPKTGHLRMSVKNAEYSYVDKVTRSKRDIEVTRQELYTLIMSGWDKFDQTKDGDVDLKSHLHYKRWSRAIGHTYPSTFKTWMNTKFWTGSETDIVALIAGNIVHEYMHNLGFDHAFDWNPTRQFSVPYAIGTIVRQLVDKSYVPGPKTFKKVCRRSWKSLWLRKTCRWVEA